MTDFNGKEVYISEFIYNRDMSDKKSYALNIDEMCKHLKDKIGGIAMILILVFVKNPKINYHEILAMKPFEKVNVKKLELAISKLIELEYIKII